MVNAPDWVKNAYRLRLEIEYRRSHGSSFQQLFNKIMRAIHGSDFVETAAMGREGDLGCDGYLSSRKVAFAVYGPAPYFRLEDARAKMRADFSRLQECWDIPNEVEEWVFVVNYPGVHPSLLKIAHEVGQNSGDLNTFVWSRSHLTQQLLLWGRRDYVETEFGKIDVGGKVLAPLSVVPEDTALPSAQAQLAHRRLWARLTCNKAEMEKLDKPWLADLTRHPWENLLAHTQILVGAMASATMAGAFDVAKISARTLQRECGVPGKHSKRGILEAWSLPLRIIMGDDYEGERLQLPQDPEKATVEIARICMTQERLTLALIRMQSRTLQKWETDVLDDVWAWASEEIKIHPE